jgi:hypothetical protein
MQFMNVKFISKSNQTHIYTIQLSAGFPFSNQHVTMILSDWEQAGYTGSGKFCLGVADSSNGEGYGYL